jgi:TPR repeat protein
MYDSGQGVTQDYKQTVKWYRKAAEQGDVRAQYSLGSMYRLGRGVTQDYKSAHMWYNISAANGYSDAVINRDLIIKEMTPSQIEKAQDMASEWMAKH